MKNTLLFLVLLLSLSTLHAQIIKDTDVPQIVRQKFKTMYPKPDNLQWEKDAYNYEAKFALKESEMAVTFDVEGLWLRTITKITATALPVAVNDYTTKNYDGYSVIDACTIKSAKDTERYQVVLKKGGTKTTLLFDMSGNIIR